ncbi:MAG: hypothetical protein ABW224_17385 [Kibdelosporangium sp.]
MSVAAERAVPDMLSELVANTISPPIVNRGFAEAGPVAIRPAPQDMSIAWSNLATLNFVPLSAYAQGNPAEAIGDLEDVLSAIVDIDEAASAFRLPYRSAGQPSLFASRSGRKRDAPPVD